MNNKPNIQKLSSLFCQSLFIWFLSYFLVVQLAQVHNTFLDQVSLLNRPFRPPHFPRCCSKFVQLPRFASLTLILLKSFFIHFHFGFHFGFGSTLASQRLSLALEMVFPHLLPSAPSTGNDFRCISLSSFLFICLVSRNGCGNR